MRAACERSLERLDRRCHDLYFLHAPDPSVNFETSVRALASIKKEGLTRALGLSNVTVGQLEAALRIVDIEWVQIELGAHASEGFEGGVPERCRELGIRLVAHRPFGAAKGLRRLARESRTEGEPALFIDADQHLLAKDADPGLGAAVAQLASSYRLELPSSGAQAATRRISRRWRRASKPRSTWRSTCSPARIPPVRLSAGAADRFLGSGWPSHGAGASHWATPGSWAAGLPTRVSLGVWA